MMGRRCLIMVMVFVVSLFVLMPSTWAKDGEDPDAAWTTGVSRGLAYEQEDLKGTWTSKVWAGTMASALIRLPILSVQRVVPLKLRN